jgi:hypothetical protein
MLWYKNRSWASLRDISNLTVIETFSPALITPLRGSIDKHVLPDSLFAPPIMLMGDTLLISNSKRPSPSLRNSIAIV